MPRRKLRPDSPGGRPRILFAEPDAAFRMRAIDCLRDRFEVITVPDAVDPVRKARTEGPELVLLSARPGSAERTLRACRLLKAELDPPAVGVLNLDWARLSAQQALDAGADGYLAGRPELSRFADWVEQTYEGERPVVELERPGLLRRFARKLRG